jgi:hypothetical protein
VAIETISVPARFNGPLDSGNGGYSCGVVAGLIDGLAEVSLRSPVPLDTELAVERGEDACVRVLHGETLVAEGRPAPDFEVEAPAPVTPDVARRASRGYRGATEGPFSRCFVCGRAREDSFGLFAGAVEGRDLVASPWTPPAWTGDEDGNVRPELIWASLDCPASFAPYRDREMPLALLGRLAARIEAPVVAGTEHVVIGWPLGREGRKVHAGSAVLSADGTVLARARALLIEVRPDAASGS